MAGVLELIVLASAVVGVFCGGEDVNSSVTNNNRSLTARVGGVALDQLLEIWEPWMLVNRWSGWLTALQDPSLANMGASPDDIKWRECSSQVANFLRALNDSATWAIQSKL